MQWWRAGLPGHGFFDGLYGMECAARISSPCRTAASLTRQPAQHDSTVNWSSQPLVEIASSVRASAIIPHRVRSCRAARQRQAATMIDQVNGTAEDRR